MSTKSGSKGLLARVNFPLYAIQKVTERHILVAGGGGAAKTGVANCIELYELIKCENTDTCRAVRVTHLDTGMRAIMNANVFHNGNHFILATGGMNGICELFQMRLVANNPKNDILLNGNVRHSSMGNGFAGDNGHIRRRRKTSEGVSEPTPLTNGHAAHMQDDDYPELSFDIHKLTSFQADCNSKNEDDSFLKVIKFSPIARLLITGGSDGCLRLFGYPDLKLLNVISAHQNDIDDLDIDPNGTRLVSISKDGRGLVWNLKTRSKVAELQFQHANTDYNGKPVKYSFRGCKFGLVEGDTNNVALFTAMNPLVRAKPANPSYLCKWDTQRYGLTKLSSPCSDTFSCMAISDDGRFIGVGMLSGSVEIYISFSLQKIYTMNKAHNIFVTGVEFLSSSEETRMLTGNHDASLVSISVDNHMLVHHIPVQKKIGLFSVSLLFIITMFFVYVMLDVMGL